MKVLSINHSVGFKSQKPAQEKPKREFIDSFLSLVQNQSDVNDCVAVPRGIFKAYLWIMSGAGLLGIAGALPAKLKKTKSAMSIIGNLFYVISAFYFAKPFAFKGVSPTIKSDEFNTKKSE